MAAAAPVSVLITVTAICLCLLMKSGLAQEKVGGGDRMAWTPINDTSALCNDYTQAGYFIRRNESSNDWIVFLESGGLCFNRESCNRRFFVRKVREEFRDDSLQETCSTPCTPFDPSKAWRETILEGRDPTLVISPLMTSMKCFQNVSEFFPNGMDFSIEGRDILDTDSTRNPLFHSYNHVVIPYCSSDVWLGEQTNTTEAVEADDLPCECFDYTSSDREGCFNFDPDSTELQFTFRGKAIYQSVIKQLLGNGMENANKVIVAGSSAGGIGAINHAKWTREQLDSSSTSETELMVLTDSAWFIDFQNGSREVFNGLEASSGINQHLLELIIKSNPACNDADRLGNPCCLSASCMLTQQNSTDGKLQYYPEDTPTFALFSIYDIYLLSPGLARVQGLETAQGTANSGDNLGGVSSLLDYLRVIGEYGGIMRYTLDTATTEAGFLSYYVTQCFQHIYLATSTLWGEDGQSVFGSDSLEFTRGTTSFSHFISSNRWDNLPLAANESDVQVTVREALYSWINEAGPVRYVDICQGALCNSQCPDELSLGELTSNNWHIGVKLAIAALINIVALFCVAMKLSFMFWLRQLEKKQRLYLESLDDELESTDEATLPLPYCDETAVSVSCLDLCYAIKFKDNKALKDERKDKTAPVVLQNLDEDDSSSESEEEQGTQHPSPRSPLKPRLASALRQFSTKSLPDPNKIDRRKLSRQKSFDAESKLFALTKKPTQTDLEVGKRTMDGRTIATKNILKGVSVYFNPGKMVGIMGPSGCGKTTFLDLLTGRRKTGIIKGAIYVNGSPIDDIREWYIANTGYVLQLATPYYEELTVRENLTLAAQLSLSKGYTLREKFKRVEQVMNVTGLSKLSGTKVGGATGPGLSGGQKKRLVIALQLLNLPSIIFLDEPTSGLDATASFELLTHLNKLADSNRTVVLTIHQPRLEIFHMFHQLVLLSDGKVAYHDVPDKAYEVFLGAITNKYLEQRLVIPSLVGSHNPADVIMDMLGNPKMRQIITENYQRSKEPMRVRRAIITARWREYSVASVESIRDAIHHIVHGAKHTNEQGSLFTRMAVLEARASKRFHLGRVAFFPFMFFFFGFIMGTSYFQVHQTLLVISGMCVYSTASALFMFPAMYPYYQRALEVYGFEKADGVGKASDLVIQGFIRFAAITFVPLIIAVTTLYLLLVNVNSYQILVYLQVLLVNIALNQTWIAILIALICIFPESAFRFSQVISAVAGFSSGFFIPTGLLPPWYEWVIYINPNYFGLSSVAFFVLSDFETDCTGTQVECYISSGPYTLGQFFFDEVNPYLHLAILLGFTVFFLFLAIFANWIRHTVALSRLKRIKLLFKKSGDALTQEFHAHHSEYERHFSRESAVSEDPRGLCSVAKEDESAEYCKANESGEPTEEAGVAVKNAPNRARGLWRSAANRTIREGGEEAKKVNWKYATASNVSIEEDSYHQVWRPTKQPRLADLVATLGKMKEKQKKVHEPLHQTASTSAANTSLRSRQQMIQDRIKVTQEVLTDEILSEERTKTPKMSFKEASKRITLKLQMQQQEKEGCRSLSDVVSLYLAKKKTEEFAKGASPNPGDSTVPAAESYQTHHGKAKLHKRRSNRGIDKSALGAIPLEKWHKLVSDNKTSVSSINGGFKIESEL